MSGKNCVRQGLSREALVDESITNNKLLSTVATILIDRSHAFELTVTLHQTYVQQMRCPSPRPSPPSTTLHLRTLHRNARTPTTLVPLRRQNLIVVRTQFLTVFRPRIKMGLHIDRSADALLLAHAPELLEGPAVDDQL